MAAAQRLEELVSWQRMHELNVEVWKATDRGPASRDFDFRDEIRDAADSTERNVAEGFGRYNPGVFANFLDYSRASAHETRSPKRFRQGSALTEAGHAGRRCVQMHHPILLEPVVWVRDFAQAWRRIQQHAELLANA